MTREEKALASLLPTELACITGSHSFPSLSHCVGTNKLIGESYGKAIVEECGLGNTVIRKSLSELSCLLRAYIVLDDFAKDQGICADTNPALFAGLDSIKARCLVLAASFVDDPTPLWHAFREVYEHTYEFFDANRMYDSIVKKCCLIFLPFELPAVSQTPRCSIVRDAMKDYLFCLQLIDDFQDMEEDLRAPMNHNLFVAGLSPEAAGRVILLRPLIVRSLFSYVEQNLCSVRTCFTGSTAQGCLQHSLDWVRSKSHSFRQLPLLELFPRSLSAYSFERERLLGQTAAVRNLIIPNLQDIRAERMHTSGSNKA